MVARHPAAKADKPDKAALDEVVAWLRTLWTVPISNEDLTAFFRWSREKPALRAVYDDLSARLFDAMLAEPPRNDPSPTQRVA